MHMKHFLLALVAAFCISEGANAQLVQKSASQVKAPKTALTARPDAKLQSLPQGSLKLQANPELKLNLPHRDSRAYGDETRSNQEISFVTDPSQNSIDEWWLAATGLSYSNSYVQAYMFGYASYFPETMYEALIGNTITEVEFFTWYGVYENAFVFLLDGSGNLLWSQDLEMEEYAIMSVTCDYEITGDEGGIYAGFVANLSQSDNDPYASSYGMTTAMFDDNTELGTGFYMMYSDGENFGVFYDLGTWYDDATYTSTSTYAYPIWLKTEGDNYISSVDASLASLYTAREKGVNKQYEQYGTVSNCGLETINSLSYTFELDGAYLDGTYTFTDGLPPFSSAAVPFTCFLPETQKHAEGTLTITAVNGAADEDASNNSSSFDIYALGNYPVDRNVLVEEHTGLWCGYCPRGIVGMDALKEAFGRDRVNVVTIHYDDDLYTDVLFPVIYLYASSYGWPSAFINRELYADPYYGFESDCTSAEDGIVAAVQEYMDTYPYCEAKLGFTSSYDSSDKTITVSSTIDFVIDTESNEYSVAYYLTEDERTGSQYNYYNGWTSYGYTLNDDLTFLNTAGSYYNATFNDVALYLTDTHGYDYTTGSLIANETGFLPATTAGSTLTHTASFEMPDLGSDWTRMSIVALLYDNKTFTIIQSAYAYLAEATTGIESATTSEQALISVDNGAFTVTANDAKAEVYSLDGKLVSSAHISGTTSLPTFGHGVYVIRVIEDGNVTTKKATF